MKWGNEPPITGAVVYEINTKEAELNRRLAEADALAVACDGFATAKPELSAKFGLTQGQRAGGWALLGAACIFLLRSPDDLGAIGLALASAVFSAVILLRISAGIAAAIRTTARYEVAMAPAITTDAYLPVTTYLVPAYREANMAAHIVEAIGALDYPASRLDVKLLVEADDSETVAAFRALRLPEHIEIIPVPHGLPRTKPKALNYGLAFAKGDIIAVLDAEDLPHPEQARAAAKALMAGPEELAVVQAPLSIYNGGRAWIAAQSALEYAVHFGAWLPLMQRMQWPLLLGGTSNYFRRAALIEVGGWDPYNVTEDADLGLRLSRAGYHACMIEPPTREEAPLRMGHWLNQRSRWIKGHIQTWLVLMRNPLTAIHDLGVWGFIGAQVSLGGSLLTVALHGPLLLWTLFGALSLAPLGVWSAALFGSGYASVAFAAIATGGLRGRWLAVLTLPLYWPLLSIALVRALWGLKTSPHYWAKTPHGVSRG